MIRLVCFALFFPAFAQQGSPPPDVSAQLEKAADKRASEWDTLAQGLEAKIARMLPCDPRIRAAIEEVSRASDARLAALSKYLENAAAEAKADGDRARKALAQEQAAIPEIETQRMEAAQQRTALDGQIADLTESAKRRPALNEAKNKLVEIRAKMDDRVAIAQEEAKRRAALAAALQDLALGCDARQRAVAAELTALASETARWSEYYAARLARAQTECSITNQGSQRKKQ